MIDINKTLQEMEKKTEKSWTYLKGLFNAANSEYAETFGDSLPDENRIALSLNKVGKKYGLEKEDMEELIISEEGIVSVEDKQLAEDIEEMFEAEESTLEITDDPNHGDGSPDAWRRFLAAIPNPTKPKTDYKKTPSLIVNIGPTYYLKMTDPKTPPPEGIEFDGTYGKYIKYPLKVTLIKISDEEMYDVIYKGGNFEGELAFVDGQDYTIWLDEKSIGFYKLFWLSVNDRVPDDRIFTYKIDKKGKYNVYTYKEAKK